MKVDLFRLWTGRFEHIRIAANRREPVTCNGNRLHRGVVRPHSDDVAVVVNRVRRLLRCCIAGRQQPKRDPSSEETEESCSTSSRDADWMRPALTSFVLMTRIHFLLQNLGTVRRPYHLCQPGVNKYLYLYAVSRTYAVFAHFSQQNRKSTGRRLASLSEIELVLEVRRLGYNASTDAVPGCYKC